MLRSTIFAFSCFIVTTASQAQTIVPVEREPVYTKEDIFDRLSPLAPAKPAESLPAESATPAAATSEPATSEPATTHVPPAEEVIEDSPVTTVRVRQPESTAPPSAPRAEQATAPPSPPIARSSAAELSPKLKALLKPQSQPNGQPATVPAHVPGALTALSAEELRTLIAHVAKQFDKDLGSLKNGERWQNYLRLDELQAACQAGADEAAVELLPEIGRRFGTLAGDAEYITLTKRSSFQTLNIALGEFLSLDDQRLARQQLLTGVERLQQSLTPIPTGAQWMGYFELSSLRRLGAHPTPVSEHDLVQLQLLLSRFEQAATDEKFASIAKLDGFTATQESLRGILGVGQRPTLGDAVAAAPAEVAPTEVATGEYDVPDESEQPLAQASATVERLPVSVDGMQIVALGGKSFLRKQGDAAWKQIGKSTAKSGDAISARDEFAQVVLGEDFALQLAAQTTLTFGQRASDKTPVTELKLSEGSVKAIANGRSGNGVLHLAMGDYQLAVSGDDFAIEFRVEAKDGRAVAIVHAGEAIVENSATGDRAMVRAGREAVLLASGIALRGAPAKSDDWWAAPADRPRSARRNGGGFSE